MSSVKALAAALDAAGPGLVGNDEVLRSVLAGSGDCIKILDLDGRLQFMSEGGQRVMEVEDFTKLKGCPWPDFWEGAGNEEARAAVAAALVGKTRRFRNAANTAKGNPRVWDVVVSPIPDQMGRPQYLLSISRDITAQVDAETRLAESVKRQRWLTAELAHRLKNTVASIMSIARQSFRGVEFDAPRETFLSRLKLLDDANDVLTGAQESGASVSEIVTKALAPYRTGRGRFSIAGPHVMIGAKHALTLMLALHELATNAVKYGALSNDSGGVDLHWSLEESSGNCDFKLVWREHGGPPVAPPVRRGFGSRLLERLFAADFGGTVALDYAAEGVTFSVATPLASICDPAST